MNKIIDSFNVTVKAPLGKTYYSTEYVFNSRYILKVGDRIAALRYEGRGLIFYHLLILEITEQIIVVKSDLHEKPLTFKYNKEPNYKNMVGAHFIGEENRKLIFYPFPMFSENIKVQDIKSIKNNPSKDIFYIHNDSYICNFNNINEVQFSIL